MSWRNVVLLGAGQAMGLSGVTMVVFLGGLVGARLAPVPAWSTLPVGLMVIGVAASTAPAALLMKRIGRRRGFVSASALGCLAAVLAALSIGRASFPLFCLATALLGANGAFIAQYRFAAAESVPGEQAGKAVAFVLIGGMVAGLLGPELGGRGRDWSALGPFSGSFLGLAALYLLTACLLAFLRDLGAPADPSAEAERPLGAILRQPVFLVALLAGVVSYGVMSFTMTAMPVSMRHLDHFPLPATARVIQSHIMAMYAPSLFAGFLVRLGLVGLMAAGVLAMAGSAAVALAGHQLPHYWAAMVLLGIGWNFLFVGGTALLTHSYRPAERFKAQALNELLVFGFQALASLSAGAVLFLAGWKAVNLLTLPLLAAMAVALLGFRRLSPQ